MIKSAHRDGDHDHGDDDGENDDDDNNLVGQSTVKVLTNMMYVWQRRNGCKQSTSDVSLMRREQRNGIKSIWIISNDDVDDDNDGDDDYDDFQRW